MREGLTPLMESNRDDWETPQELFEALDGEFGFTHDAAANAQNAKVDIFYGPGSPLAEDALAIDWEGRVWCNPPYGRLVDALIAKAKAGILEHRVETAVFLLPARTDTKWFHSLLGFGAEIRFLKGRLKFELNGQPITDTSGHAVGAPFPSLIAVLKPLNNQWSVVNA